MLVAEIRSSRKLEFYFRDTINRNIGRNNIIRKNKQPQPQQLQTLT